MIWQQTAEASWAPADLEFINQIEDFVPDYLHRNRFQKQSLLEWFKQLRSKYGHVSVVFFKTLGRKKWPNHFKRKLNHRPPFKSEYSASWNELFWSVDTHLVLQWLETLNFLVCVCVFCTRQWLISGADIECFQMPQVTKNRLFFSSDLTFSDKDKA